MKKYYTEEELKEMKVGERKTINDTVIFENGKESSEKYLLYLIHRVPNGYIFELPSSDNRSSTTTFVPCD